MDVNTISNYSPDLQSMLVSKANGVTNRSNNDYADKTAYYAKKGEPMYMDEMDSDKDGTVTLDEFREYCGSKGMSTRDMVKMSQLASSYRTMKAENDTIDYISKLTPNVSPKLKQAESESVYAKKGDGKYNVSMDSNRDSKVTYKEYMAYCQKNAGTSHEFKSDAKLEETDNGRFKVTNSGKAIESYEKSEGNIPESLFEDVA